MTYTLWHHTNIHTSTPPTVPVQTAIGNLRRDIDSTLDAGKSGGTTELYLMDDASCLPETYQISVDETKIEVRAGDELGFVYALYAISEQALGVHPMWFWNDQVFRQLPGRDVPCGVIRSEPYPVRYRGWFLNDHQLLDGWTDDWESEAFVLNRIYETVLRLGGNMMITASFKEPAMAETLLAQSGMYSTQTHNAPLGAEPFSMVWKGLRASYAQYPDKYEQLWRDAVQRRKDDKIIWNVGYRGNGDEPFWAGDPAYQTPESRGGMIAEVIRRQMEIVKETVDNPVFTTNLYGEMTELYRGGYLPLPGEVIKVWGDNGYGKMVSRRQDNVNPRTDAMPVKGSGKNGVYYHVAFHDLQASNHLTMCPNKPSLIADELAACIENDGSDFIVVNCGSVKPHIYMLDLVARIWRDGYADPQRHALDYARQYTGSHATEIARMLTRFWEMAPVYGPHGDERAAEQFYHYSARYLIQAFLAGERDKPMKHLIWVAGEVPLMEQLQAIRAICENALASSDAYYKELSALRETLEDGERILFDDMLWTQAEICHGGLYGLWHVCRALAEKQNGYGSRAFVHAAEAHTCYQAGLNAMRRAEHGKWAGIYQNDSLTNIAATCYAVQGLRMWLRIADEGQYFTAWEKEYVMDPNDMRIVANFNMYREKTDEDLADAMREKYDELRPGSRYSSLTD